MDAYFTFINFSFISKFESVILEIIYDYIPIFTWEYDVQ